MATVRYIVQRAFRKLNVLQAGEALPAHHATEGQNAFNELLHSFKLRGADITHTDQDLNGTFRLGDQYLEGVIYLLASRLSPEYEMPARFDEEMWISRLQAAYFTVPTLTMPKALTRPPSREDRDGNLPLVEG